MDLAGITPPSFNWDDTNLPEQWQKFKRHVELVFSGPLKSKTEEEKVSYLLLRMGDKGAMFMLPEQIFLNKTRRSLKLTTNASRTMYSLS